VFVSVHLSQLLAEGSISRYEWVSRTNAVAPYDFTIQSPEAQERSVDAKSTEGEFGRSIHFSSFELEEMRNSDHYDVYRVFAMTDTEATCRVARDVGGFAADIVARISDLPDGVFVDAVSVKPDMLPFGPPIRIELPDTDDE
jgi:hypothetical protein